jgi:hypothetical protein
MNQPALFAEMTFETAEEAEEILEPETATEPSPQLALFTLGELRGY